MPKGELRGSEAFPKSPDDPSVLTAVAGLPKAFPAGLASSNKLETPKPAKADPPSEGLLVAVVVATEAVVAGFAVPGIVEGNAKPKELACFFSDPSEANWNEDIDDGGALGFTALGAAFPISSD